MELKAEDIVTLLECLEDSIQRVGGSEITPTSLRRLRLPGSHPCIQSSLVRKLAQSTAFGRRAAKRVRSNANVAKHQTLE
jgi:hypothetical protein